MLASIKELALRPLQITLLMHESCTNYIITFADDTTEVSLVNPLRQKR